MTATTKCEAERHIPSAREHEHPKPRPSCPWCTLERLSDELRMARAANTMLQSMLDSTEK